jgi:hypothetical protein
MQDLEAKRVGLQIGAERLCDPDAGEASYGRLEQRYNDTDAQRDWLHC